MRLLLHALGLLPERFHLVHCGFVQRGAFSAQLIFHPTEPPPEFAVGAAQSRFRIDGKIACDVYQDKEHVAHFVFNTLTQLGGNFSVAFGLRRTVGRLFNLLLQFSGLFCKLFKQAFNVWPVKASVRRFGADLLRFHERGHAAGDVIKQSLRVISRCRGPVGSSFLLLFFDLQCFPVFQDLLGVISLHVPENVGMTPNELVAQRVQNVVNRKQPLFAGHL